MDDQKPNSRPETKPDLQAVTPSLKGALRRARIEETERSQVMAELRGAEIARLEMLAEALEPVFAQVPEHVDVFDAGLMPGETPRLFIDMIGFIEMGEDKRSYRFVQNTRHGRVIVATSEKIDTMVEHVTQYVARRLVEREKALASDQTLEEAARRYRREAAQAPEQGRPAAVANLMAHPAAVGEAPARGRVWGGFVEAVVFLAELIGFIVLLIALFGALYFAWTLGEGWWQGWFNKVS